MTFEFDQRADIDAERLESLAATEFRQVDDETGRDDIGAHLLQQLDGRFRCAAGRDQVVDQNDLLPGLIASLCISISSTPYSRL